MTADSPSDKNDSDPELTKAMDVDEDLRLGTWNCASLKGEKLIKALKYCKESDCDIIALQETNHESNAGTNVIKGDFTVFYIPRRDIKGTNYKPRGRPSLEKNKNVPTTSSNASGNEKTPKKRGRPRKVHEASTAIKEEGNADDSISSRGEETVDLPDSPEKTTDATQSPLQNKKDTEKNPDQGLAFMVKTSSIGTKIKNPEAVGLDPRIAVLRFEMNGVPVSLFNIYAPVPNANNNSVPKSRECYDELSKHYKAEKKDPNRIVIICGDLNAFPEQASLGLYEPYIMSNVYGSSNKHGDVLVDFLQSNGVYHLNSRFEKVKEKKWTHQSNDPTEIDGFLSDRIDIVTDVDTFSRLDGSKDHRMVISTWKISESREDRIREKRKKIINMSDLITIKNGSLCPNEDESMFYCIEDDLSVDLKAKKHIEKEMANEFERIYGEKSDVRTSRQILHENREVPQLNERPSSTSNSDSDESDEVTSRSELETPETLALTEKEVSEELAIIQKENPNVRFEYTDDAFTQLTATLNPESFSWKKVEFRLKNPATPIKYLDDFDFIGRISISAAVYSNILAQKSNEHLSKYIYDDHEFESSEIRLQEKEIEQQHRLILTLLRDKFEDTPLYFLFVKFKKPFESLKLTSAMKSLQKANVEERLISAFSSLLLGMEAELIIGNDSRIIEKHHGLHLGDITSRLLMKAVLKMVFEECGESGSTFEYPRKIIHDNGIVIIDDDIENIQSRLESFARISEIHGLHVDENSIALLKNASRTGENEFNFRGRTYRTADSVVNRVNTFMDQVICMRSCSAATVSRNDRKAWEVLYNMTLVSNDMEEKLDIIRDHIIPMLFNGCETWKSLKLTVGKKSAFDTMTHCLESFKKHLGIENFNVDIVKYVIHQKALMLDRIKKRDNICKTLGTTPGKAKHPLLTDVLKDFKEYMKSKFEENDTLKNLFEKDLEILESINLIDFIEKEKVQKCWNNYKEDCKSKRFPLT